MNKIVNKHQAVCGVVWIVIFCIIILRPQRFVTEKPVVQSNQQMTMQSGAIRGDCLAAQKFVAPYSHLKAIRIYFLNEMDGEEFRFILFDADMSPVMDQTILVEDMEEMPGFYTVILDQDMEAGVEYCYMIQGVSTDFYVAYEDTAASGTDYNGILYYNGMEVRGQNIITEYDYEIPFGKSKTFVCYTLVVLFGILVSFLSKKYYEKYPDRNRLLTVERVWKWIASPIVIVSAIVLLAAIWPCNLFSAGSDVIFDALDIIFYDAGILISMIILLYGIHHKRNQKSSDMGLSILRDRWTDYLQAVFFALAIQSGVHYMNGLYEIHHIIAYREMLIYFGLSVIATYKRKEIFNLVNLFYLILAAIAGGFYYRSCVTPSLTEMEKRIVWLTIWAAVIAGIIIINTISIIAHRQIRRISKYGIILAVIFALLIVFRNTRGWPIYLVCVFSLYYLRMAVWEKRERLLQNICNGILLHFLVMTGYCLLHRPYQFYNQTRYSFIFHTVTVAAEYLSLVICAALVKLLQAYRKEPKLSYIWKELTVFGISLVYLFITLSRTGYLAIIVMLLVVLPSVCLIMRYKMKTLSTITAMLFISFILCFPAVFTLQRIIPSVVAQPEMFEIEWIPDEIKDRRDTDSRYYITIRRFVQLFENKVLGIPEGKCIVPYKKPDLYSEGMLVASASLSGAVLSGAEEPNIIEERIESYTSGRLDIFKLYIANFNMTGHDDMAIILPDGTIEASHAHNTYIQAAYDHGVPVGIAFVLFGFCTLIQSVIYYKKGKDGRLCSLLPFALLITFAAAGLTEWIFHPCNPLAFCMLSALSPLLYDIGMDNREYNGDGSE